MAVKMDLKLVQREHLPAFVDYAEQCSRAGLTLYTDVDQDYLSFLEKRIAYSKGEQLPAGWSTIHSYFCFEDEQIVGAIRLRDGDNDYIQQQIGHIGFETRPSLQGQGIASFMLNSLVKQLSSRTVIITCDEQNFGSQRVIIKCGARRLADFVSAVDDSRTFRYQLDT